MYFDTHAHYDDRQFDPDRDELLSSMPANGIELILDAGSDLSSSRFALELTKKYPFLYSAAGVHPHDAKGMTRDTLPALEDILQNDKVVAVGEIGLDYHYDFSPRDIQRRCFQAQLELARKVKKPVVIHEREACADAMEIVRGFRDIVGVFHCFSGSWETARELLDMGWYLSFTGVITFKNARRALEVIEKMPRERIMIETDSPYLAPDGHRGTRNSSLYLPEIAAKVGEILGISREEAAALTLSNGKRFFGIA